jgi:hypothetical protein
VEYVVVLKHILIGDSLKYRSVYGLDNVLTLYRGTIRKVGFSKAWNMFVQLGMTDRYWQWRIQPP